MSIRVKTFLALIVVPAILFTGIFFSLFMVDYTRSYQMVRSTVQYQGRSIRDALNLELVKNVELLRGIAANPLAGRFMEEMAAVPEGLDNDDFGSLPGFEPFKELMESVSEETNVDLVYAAGVGSPGIITGRDLQMAEGFDVRSRDYYQAATDEPGIPQVSSPRISAEKSDVPIIVVTVAEGVTNPLGDTVGIVAFNYRLNHLIDITKEQIQDTEFQLSLVDTSRGLVLWHQFSDMEYFYNPDDPRSIDTLFEDLGQTGDVLTATMDGMVNNADHYFDGHRQKSDVLAQTISIPGTPWHIVTTFPKRTILQDVFNAIAPLMGGFLLILLLIQTGIFIFINRIMVRPILDLGANLENLALADADLTVRIQSRSRDEIGKVAVSFNTFVEKLGGLIGGLKTAIDSTEQIEAQVSSSTEETSASIEEIASNLDSITQLIDRLDNSIRENVTAIEQITGNIASMDSQIVNQSSMVDQSTSAITQMMASLDSVNGIAQNKKQTTRALTGMADEGKTRIEDTVTTFRAVEGHLAEVQDMATAINDIASQTNLLSMNAAIEAAHAGEAGKGFAVVAEEIRKLAESSSESSKSISQVLKNITDSVAMTGRNMEATSVSFERISKEVNDTVGAFAEIESAMAELALGGKQILDSSQGISEVTSNIRSGSAEIKSGTGVLLQSSSTIKNISDQVTSGMAESSVGTREIVTAMGHLVATSLQLKDIVTRLKERFGQFRT